MTARSVIPPEPLEAFEARAAKIERFKALIQGGLDDLEAGRVEIVEDLGAWFDQVEAELDEAMDVPKRLT
jgi:predicted transcriptional regulator